MFVLLDYNNISKFLNRILGIEVELQNKLFRYFTDTLTSVILDQKRRGSWDMGILGTLCMHVVQSLQCSSDFFLLCLLWNIFVVVIVWCLRQRQLTIFITWQQSMPMHAERDIVMSDQSVCQSH